MFGFLSSCLTFITIWLSVQLLSPFRQNQISVTQIVLVRIQFVAYHKYEKKNFITTFLNAEFEYMAFPLIPMLVIIMWV